VKVARKAKDPFTPFFVREIYRRVLGVKDHSGIEHVEKNNSENGHDHGRDDHFGGSESALSELIGILSFH
jgi:hypothetical protein